MTPWMTFPTLGTRDHYLMPLLAGAQMPVALLWTGQGEAPDYAALSGNPDVHLLDGHRLGVTGRPLNIYRWWNIGIDYACEQGADVLVIGSDDVEAAPGALLELAAHIEAGEPASPMLVWPHDPEHAAVRVTPIAGYAFALDPARIRPDDAFLWWWGEHDLELRARAMSAVNGSEGAVAVRVDGIRHLRTDGTYEVDLSREIARDRRLFAARYPDLMRG